MLADMIIGIPWKHYNAAEQQNEQINEAMRQITNVIKRTQKRGRCQNIAKYITEMLNTKKVLNEHKLQTNTTACKCLNNSRHGNLLLRKQSPQIADMCDAFIWTIFNLFDLTVPLTLKYG